MRQVHFAAVTLCAIVASPAIAGSYTFTPIGPPGVSNFLAVDINDSGTIVGTAYYSNFVYSQSYIGSGGVYTQFSVPGSIPATTIVSAINNLGQHVGFYTPQVGQNAGFQTGYFYDGSNYQPINPPIANGSVALGVNDHGQVVGISGFDSGPPTGFSYANGVYSTVAVPDATNTTPEGVNNCGVIVGSYLDANSVSHSFILQGGQYTSLDDPLAGSGANQGTFFSSINSLGEIVGSYTDANGVSHGLVYRNGTFATVDDPLAVSQMGLVGLNDLGRIVGAYADASGTYYSFLATPVVPEPGTLTLLAVAGLARVGGRLRKRF